MTTGNTIALTRWAFIGKVMSLLFNMMSRFAITSFPRNKSLLISRLQSPSAVILEPPKNKVAHCFHCFPIYLPWSEGTVAMILVFWMLSFKPDFSLSSFTFIKRLFSSSLLSAIRMVSSAYWLHYDHILTSILFKNKVTFWGSRKDMHFGETLSNQTQSCLLDQLLFIEPIIRSSCRRHFILTKPVSEGDYDYPWTTSVARRNPVALEGLGWLRRYVFPREITFF